MDEDKDEDLVDYYLEDFVPPDYNVKEVIRGGHDSPNYENELDEDCDPDEWWSLLDDSIKKSMIVSALLKLKPFFKSKPNELIYRNATINIHLPK